MSTAEQNGYKPGDHATWATATVTTGPVGQEQQERATLISDRSAQLTLTVGRVIETGIPIEGHYHKGTRVEVLLSNDASQTPGMETVIPGDFTGFIGVQDDFQSDELRSVGIRQHRTHQVLTGENGDTGLIKNEATPQGVEDAVLGFFEGVDTTAPGHHMIGNKSIIVLREQRDRYASDKHITAEVIVDGLRRAIVSYRRGEISYMQLISEPDADGYRARVIYNGTGGGRADIKLYEVPGIELSHDRLLHTEPEQIAAALRLGIKLNVPRRQPEPKTRR